MKYHNVTRTLVTFFSNPSTLEVTIRSPSRLCTFCLVKSSEVWKPTYYAIRKRNLAVGNMKCHEVLSYVLSQFVHIRGYILLFILLLNIFSSENDIKHFVFDENPSKK